MLYDFSSYVESNEQTELTKKMGVDSQVERRWTALGGLGIEGLSKNGKRTHGHGQQCGDC